MFKQLSKLGSKLTRTTPSTCSLHTVSTTSTSTLSKSVHAQTCIRTSTSLSSPQAHIRPATRDPTPEQLHHIQQANATAAAQAKAAGAKKTTAPAQDYSKLSDEQIVELIETNKLRFFNIERDLNNDYERAVRVRRMVVERKMNGNVKDLPFQSYNYAAIAGQCCENVVGYVPIPVGVAGPLVIDGQEFYLPMATTEGALVASTTRGCKALSLGGGVRTEVTADGMSRAPVLSVPSIAVANEIKRFIASDFQLFYDAFAATSRFGRLQSIDAWIAGRQLFLRFKCSTGDAMGMNMVGKGVEQALKVITDRWPEVSVAALSGNMCTDKKPSAINWITGRGKSVSCEAVIPGHVVREVLKTTTDAIVECNYSKNLVGSAMAGSIGGQNAHASNIVAAMFLATGQDPAQNVESSNCITLLERHRPGSDDLYMSITMPCMEVGTVGGGTALAPQSSMLSLLGVKGSHPSEPGQNAKQLARIIAGGVMAGELSLIAALSSGHLIKSHMALNRKPATPTAH